MFLFIAGCGSCLFDVEWNDVACVYRGHYSFLDSQGWVFDLSQARMIGIDHRALVDIAMVLQRPQT